LVLLTLDRQESAERHGPDPAGRPSCLRPCAIGKFLFVGGTKFYVRGVTYGTFQPTIPWGDYPDPGRLAADFSAMAANGINAVRTYTTPPIRLLDLASAYGLRVLVGLAWEQHVAFLGEPKRQRDIRRRVREQSRRVAGHPALLGYAIGNEIPAPIVRWHGRRPIVRFLRELYEEVKTEDPFALVTYVNYPTTEYLELPFLDFVSFNVYLERREALADYLARLQNLTGERPLLMTEIGLDSNRHGVEAQASVLSWQIRASFQAGCAGTFAFAWTDEWHRGGHDVADWDFGLTTRNRQPKPSLKAVRSAYAEVPAAPGRDWPPVSVVVCSYNGESTIRDTLEATASLAYPDYEVIVVDDGSTDRTASIASEYPVRLIRTENQGLSAARNVGLAAATGEIVVYTDDDAYPDPDWLTYLASAFADSDAAAFGGPNLLPQEDGPMAACVYHAPGGPSHVLLSDREGEHLPGCNMAFRRECLEAIGGFDPHFRIAGDDVDVCWRLRERGWVLGFHAAACVFHHRRNSLRAYWRQQVAYGRAEVMLERKWPHRHNGLGHTIWSGRIYGPGLTRRMIPGSGRIYQGTWGSAPFQSVYGPAHGMLGSLPLMPEWLLLIGLLAALSALGIAWPPLRWALVALLPAAIAPVVQAVRSAGAASLAPEQRRAWSRAQIALLHLAQPTARLWGRLREKFTPWRRRDLEHWTSPRPTAFAIWSEQWQSPTHWLGQVESALGRSRCRVRRGGDWDRWDLEVRTGLFGRVRTLMAVEEHGSGRQYLRFRLVPCHRVALGATLLAGLVAGGAILDGALAPGVMLTAGALGLVTLILWEAGIAMGRLHEALSALRESAALTPVAGAPGSGSQT
jgi:GT2 family glycosyltransferase